MSRLGQIVYHPLVGRRILAPVARWGYRRHLRTGTTPPPAYRAMRKLYGCRATEPFAALAAATADEVPLLDLPGDGAGSDADAPGTSRAGIAAAEVDAVVAALSADGYAVLGHLLDSTWCDELEATARAATCTLVGPARGSTGGRARFQPDAPEAVRYDLDEADVVASPAAQRLIADPSLLEVAQRHLGAAPVQDLVTMWWSAAVEGGGGSASAAAQQFHFDLDRLRFVKVFVYLTDVDEQTGPHVYVRGSHRSKPDALRRDGRHDDAEIAAAFPGEERHISGPRGTVFLADTIGLHKGLPVQGGHRLVFQTEYASSLFGAPFTEPEVITPTPELAAAAEKYPQVFRRFRFGHPAEAR
ncbi:MAG: hypothetical protein JWM89_3933 [Acidimicrobiales bacterium]|nr:hypothetical protein [Acidimicrobiales bacterium]